MTKNIPSKNQIERLQDIVQELAELVEESTEQHIYSAIPLKERYEQFQTILGHWERHREKTLKRSNIWQLSR